MDFSGNIIEGIGNELLFLFGCVGTIVFLVIAWLSTWVNWELLPIRITLLHHAGEEHQSNLASGDLAASSTSEETTDTQTPDTFDYGLSESSDSSCEDVPSNEMCVRSRRQGSPEVQAPADKTDGNPTTNTNANQQEKGTASSCREHFVLRLQYLDDRSRLVHASPNMSIVRFKRKHFPDELIQQKKNVRLIFQGRELIEFRPAEVPSPRGRPKAQRLRDYGVTNGSTIHCLITPLRSTNLNGQRPASRSETQRPARNLGFASSSNESILTEFDIGTRLMKPLFAFLLLFTWFFRVAYRQYFNSVSTFALVALTVFFCGAVFTVNAASTLASVLGIATADSDMRSLIENPADGNSDGDGSTHQNDLQVVTVTMVARRFPAQPSVQLPQNSTPSSSDSNTTQSSPVTNNQS